MRSNPIRRGIKQLGWFVLTFAWSASLARSQSDVRALLEQIASNCRGLYLRGYVVDIYRLQRSRPRFDAGPGASDRRGIPIPAPPMPDSRSGNRITLARKGDSLRYELRNSIGETWQWTTDGHTVWCYRLDLNAYTETKADPWPKQHGPGPGLPGIEWKYFTKFLAIADMGDRARILRDDISPDANCPGASVLIELTLAEGREAAKEQLRVLTQSHVPCESVIYRRRSTSRAGLVDSRETIVWRFRDALPDPDLLAFTPRKHANRVKHFPRS